MKGSHPQKQFDFSRFEVSGPDKTLHLVCQVNVADDVELEEQSKTRSDSQIAALTLHLHGGVVPPYMSLGTAALPSRHFIKVVVQKLTWGDVPPAWPYTV